MYVYVYVFEITIFILLVDLDLIMKSFLHVARSIIARLPTILFRERLLIFVIDSARISKLVCYLSKFKAATPREYFYLSNNKLKCYVPKN